MENSFYYNNNLYIRRTESDQMKGFILASAASGLAYKSLGLFGIPVSKQLSHEYINNVHYKNALNNAIKISGLEEKGMELIEAQNHPSLSQDYYTGKNACYDTLTKKVIVNTDKSSILAYHELGHAMNALKGGLPKIFPKMRFIGYSIAGLMEYFAIFSRTKPKEAQKSFSDKIEDNCGKIAFISLLPMVAEEGLASFRGVKLAKKTSLPDKLIKNMKTLYRKALYTYIGRAIIGGLAVFASRKIMDYYTFPQKVDSDIYNYFG